MLGFGVCSCLALVLGLPATRTAGFDCRVLASDAFAHCVVRFEKMSKSIP